MSYFPEFHDSSIAAVRLLQGAVYVDDRKIWDVVLAHRGRLENYFARIGLVLVIDEPEGFAYLRQTEEEELPEGYDRMPKLIRKSRLGYELTLFCVLLRDALRRFDEQQLEEGRCLADLDEIQSRLGELIADGQDPVRLRKKFEHLLGRAQDLGFVRKLPTTPPAYEIRPILKARITAERLEELKSQLEAASPVAQQAEVKQDVQLPG